MKNILVIAGHGGSPYDPGACGCGQKEAVLTRELAKLVQAELQKISDVKATLYNIANDAYKILKNGGSLPLAGVNYVLELHFNAAANDLNGDGKTTGTEVLVHTSESGVTVEEAICKKICALGFKNRGVKRRSGLLVMNTVKRHDISHALIETCFIDDADDMKLYLANKEKVARAIVAGVAEGFGLSMSPSSSGENLNWSNSTSLKTQTEKNNCLEIEAIKNTFDGLYNVANPLYQSLEEVPDYWKKDVADLIRSGAVKGDGKHEISIRRDALQAAIIAYRMMKN